MKIVHLGAIVTASLIGLGLLLIIPPYTRGSSSANASVPVMLTFSVLDDKKTSDSALSTWCKGLSSILDKHDLRAVVFVSGRIANRSPECVTSFSSGIDIGSQTYDYVNLTAIADYSEAVQQVKDGKAAVDSVGNFNSLLFRAPYGSTDGNIYSLLTRANIVADFSYHSQYNKYENGQFIKYPLHTISGTFDELSVSVDEFANTTPIAIDFDNSAGIEQIDTVLSRLQSDYGDNVQFLSASELTGIPLTIRGEGT